jgi:hypothetical protein
MFIFQVSFASYRITYTDKTFSFTLTLDSVLSPDKVNYQCIVKTISVTRRSDNKLIQVITPRENYASCGLPSNQIFFIEDMNFDGCNDIRLLQFLPAGPNLPYYYWMYNPKIGKFQSDTTLEDITSPDFDIKTKTIFSSWRDGYYTRGGNTYNYINGKITLVEQTIVEIDNETNKETVITKKFIDGQLKEVERKIE